MAMEEKYDVALLGILQHEGKIERFLNIVLGFLYRRTDFYRLMKDKTDKLGFPPGVALKMLSAIFKQYDDLTRRDDEMRLNKMLEAEQKKRSDEVKNTAAKSKPDDATTTNTKETSDGACETAKVEPKVTSSAPNTNEQKMDVDTPQEGSGDKSEDSNIAAPGDSVAADKSDTASGESAEAKTIPEKKDSKSDEAEEKEDSELTRQQKLFQANPDSYNGAVRDNYSWAQSITDVDLKVKVPPYVRKGKECQVEISKKHVKVAYKDNGGQWKVVVDGDLIWEIDKEESMWSLNPGQNVHINFEKKEERWWEAVLTDEPKINVRKIDASRPMTDLDDEAQSKIEEMMYNDRQKKLGLPQSHEQKMYDTLKTAWNAEGSPFKGQPFDPSKLNVDPSGVINVKPNS